MKKFIVFVAYVLLMTGCGETKLYNTPTKKVEMFLSNYQSLDEDVLTQLDDVVNRETTFTEEQKTRYRDLMKKHYKDLTYEIKDEKVNGDTATVTAEVEVYDYSKIMSDADKYKEEHDEFKDTETSFNDYRLDNLEKAKDKVKYTIDFTLTKVDDEWTLNTLTSEQESKIHGLYNY